MSEKTREQLQKYVEAAKLDLLDLLSRPTLNVFEFRRIAEICDIMITLCNMASSGMLLPQSITDALWASEEGKAPTLHQALGGHVFDTDTLIAEKYKAMARDHSQMRQKTADAMMAERDFEKGRRILSSELDNLVHEQAGVAAERQLLAGRMEELNRRELQLAAGEARLKQLSSGNTPDVTDAEIIEKPKEGESP